MSHEESLVAVDVAARALLQAADWPATRGLPSVPVPTTLLGQLAGACASVVEGEMPAHPCLRATGTCTAFWPAGAQQCPECRGYLSMIAETTPVGSGSHQDAICAAPGSETENRTASRPEGRTERRVREAAEGPPGVCAAVDCWRGPITPGGVCHFHSEHAQKPHPWQQMQMRAAVFQGGESE